MNYTQLRLMRLATASRYPIPQRFRLMPFVPHTGLFDIAVGTTLVTFDLSDHTQRIIAMQGVWEPHATRLLNYLLRPGSVFLDVGANWGYYSLLAAAAVGPTGQVHAFEPQPHIVAVLQRTIQHNQLTQLTANQMAVGATEGTITMYLSPDGNSELASAIASDRTSTTHPIEVPLTTLDTYVATHAVPHVAVVKVDVEGLEEAVLQGATTLLSGDDAPIVLCEISPTALHNVGSTPARLLSYLARFGYHLFHMQRDNTPLQELQRAMNGEHPPRLQPLSPDHPITTASLLVDQLCVAAKDLAPIQPLLAD